MTTTTNISAIVPSAPQAQAQTTPSQTAAAEAASASANASNAKPLVQPSSSSISPRIVVDPSAGVIIQFLSSSGQLQSQIPSSTVVAYLRAGLTPEGLSKPQQETA